MRRQIRFGNDRRADDPKKGFASRAEFLAAVAIAADGYVDERLRPLWRAAAGSDEHGNYSDPHGGFLAPEAWAPQLFRVEPEDDPCAGRLLPVPMSAPVVNVRARVDKNHTTSASGGLIVARHVETTAIEPSRQEYENIRLRAHDAMGLTFASEEVVQDSFPSFSTLLAEAYRDEFASLFLEERIRGTGVGECLGVLKSPALIVVDKEGGQAVASITGQNLIDMRARMWGYRRAVWIANHDAAPKLMTASVPIGTGGQLLQAWRAGSEEEGTPDLLLGRPLYYSEHCSTLGEVGDVICVDWRQYLDGTYQAMAGVDSIHVRFERMQRAFKFWTRNDGQPWWRAALVPKRSATTLSPYVTLAERAA